MRIFPRAKLPTPKAARRLWRKSKVRRVKEWCTGMSLYDDLTFVVMKVK